MAKPVEVNDENFEAEVENADTPVVVDFWAVWCGPCRIIAPIVEELAEEYDGKVKFSKLNVDDSPAVSTKYGIRSIPTLLVFKDGKPIDQIVGAVPKREVQKRVDAALSA
jgi:thioredoxin 1